MSICGPHTHADTQEAGPEHWPSGFVSEQVWLLTVHAGLDFGFNQHLGQTFPVQPCGNVTSLSHRCKLQALA